MIRHISFWLGFFVASIAVVLVAVGAWGVAVEKALSVVAMAFGAVIALSVVAIIVFVFRDRILKRVLGVAEATLHDVNAQAFATISAATKGDVETASQSASRLTTTLLAWYSWSTFYRWVVGTNITLLVAFAGFAGTVLLFDQNKRLREQTAELEEHRTQLSIQSESMKFQNEMSGLSLTSEFRERLNGVTEPKVRQGRTLIGLGPLEGMFRKTECTITLSEHPFLQPPNPSSISGISRLASNGNIGEQVVAALVDLLSDTDSSVRLGALQTLDKAGRIPPNTSLDLVNIEVKGITLNSEVDITLNNSTVEFFFCEKCKLKLWNSYGRGLRVQEIQSRGSIVAEGNDFEGWAFGINDESEPTEVSRFTERSIFRGRFQFDGTVGDQVKDLKEKFDEEFPGLPFGTHINKLSDFEPFGFTRGLGSPPTWFGCEEAREFTESNDLFTYAVPRE